MLFSPDHLTDRGLVPGGAWAVAVFPLGWEVFQGHFEGNPVVPAYVLLGLVRATASLALGREAEVRSVDRVKLTRPVRPGESVRCVVEVADRRVRAEVAAGGESAGTFVLRME